MAKQVIPMERYNIIAVDWQEGAEPPFDQAISNARLVAMEINMLLNTLVDEFNLIPGSVHIMGHGVGAHIAGYVGKSISGLIGRITALDPTGPRFEGMPEVVHLDYQDALYVEVIHTDGDGSDHQGTLQPFGNIDIYFNNGSHQPGCRQHDAIFNILTVRRDDIKPGTVVPDCSHKRAFKYYLNSVFEISCKFLAIPLNTPENSVITCSPHKNQVKCVSIGLDIDTKLYARQVHSKFHVKTNSCKPFCLNIYQIEINFAKCQEAEEEMAGYFILGLSGEHGLANFTFNKDSNDSQVILLGRRQMFTVHEAGMPYDEFNAVNLTWHFTTPFCYLCRNATCISELSITHVRPYVNAGDAPYKYTFCPRDGNHTILYDHRLSENFIQCKKQRQ